MQVAYKGHDISVERTALPRRGCLIRSRVIRIRDGYECLNEVLDMSASQAVPVADKARELKSRVDFETSREDPWGERYREYPAGYMQGRGAA